jgi:PAS domain S-box-containing protein
MKDQSLRVLMIEDSEDDALLLIRNLKKGGYIPVYERVETAAAMRKALKENEWEFILCDYKMPNFSGPAAIAVLKETNIDIPIIIVSGTIGEETAVECMRLGAHDYVMKSNMSRLCPAIARELKEAKARKKQKRTEEKLYHEEQRFRALAEQSLDMIALVNDEYIITYVNPAAEKFVGLKGKEIIGTRMFDYLHPDDVELVTGLFKTFFRDTSATVPQVEIRLRHVDGTWHNIDAMGTNLVQGDVVEAVIVNLRDVTDRKRAENALREAELRFRTIFDSASDGILIAQSDGKKFISANHKICEILGYFKEEIIRLGVSDIHPEESVPYVYEKFSKLLTREISVAENIPLLKKDKTISFADISGSMMTFDKQNYLVGIFRDITDRKKAEEELKNSEGKYRLLADHTKDHVWLMDFNLKVTYISPSSEKLLGYTLEELHDLPLNKLISPSSMSTAMEFYSLELSKALIAPPDYVLTRTLELELICKNGQTVWVECMFSLIRDENGKPLSILGESRNISERRQMENELRASESNFRHSLDDSPLGVRISSMEGQTIYANRAILDIYGYDSIEELKNTPLKERYTPESYDEWQNRKATRNQGEFGPAEYKISIVGKNGETRHLSVIRKEIFWNGRKQYQVIYQDITLRVQAEEKLKGTLENLRESIKTTIQVLSLASEAKDPYTAGHHRRVSHLARAIAKEQGLSRDIIEGIRMAGSIHDIGKLSVPAEILTKPARLTELEFSLIKEHSQAGYDMLKNVESPWPLADIVYQHHERMNGTGYPRNLKDDEILTAARVMAVADVVEAMSSHRPYRPSLGIEAALEEIAKNRGTLYDADVVDACLRLFREKGYQLI